MKEEELRALAECANCGRKHGEVAMPIFAKVTVERHMIDMKAVNSQQGLAMMLGGSGRLAMAMGPDRDMTIPVGEAVTFMVCGECAAGEELVLLALVEKADRCIGEVVES